MNSSIKIYVSYLAITLAIGIAPSLSSNNYEEAFLKENPNLVNSLAAGDPATQADFGCYLIMNNLEDGKKAERERTAVRYLKRAVTKNNIDAILMLGICYKMGIGCPNNNLYKAAAVELFRMAANADSAEGKRFLAECLAHATGCDDSFENKAEALSIYRKLAEQGNFEAIIALPYLLMNSIGCAKNEIEAVAWHRRAAEKGHFGAMDNLGTCLMDGIGCEKNETEAFAWYKKASVGGEPNAMNHLGDCLEHGIGCEKNVMEAATLYRLAAEKGHFGAMNNLGDFLRQGLGCKKNEEEAVIWYRKSADGGNAIAMNSLGACFNHGIGCVKDGKEAISWYRKGAEAGNVCAMFLLARSLLNGIGCEVTAENSREAIVWFEKASDAGDLDATLNLGIIYFKGIGIGKNYKHALFYLDRIKGNFRVNAMIGFIFLQEKNYERALESYKTALLNGDDVDIGFLEYLEMKVSSAKKVMKATSKDKAKNISSQLATNALQIEVEACQASTKKQFHLMLRKLEDMNRCAPPLVGTGFDSASELAQLKKLREKFKEKSAQEFSAEWTIEKKLGYIKLLSKILKNLKEKILSAEQELENERRIAALQKTLKDAQDNYLPMELASRADKYSTKETKDAAAKSLQAEKDRRHKQSMKPHGKPSHPKSKNARRTDKEGQNDKNKIVVTNGPFTNIDKPTKKVKGDISKTAWDNAYRILNAIRESKSKKDAVGRLKRLVGDFDFKKIKDLKYAGVPDADIAYQMRIDDKYRAIIAFKAETIKVYDVLAGGANNNIPTDKVIYQLCGNTIYIDDPH